MVMVVVGEHRVMVKWSSISSSELAILWCRLAEEQRGLMSESHVPVYFLAVKISRSHRR